LTCDRIAVIDPDVGAWIEVQEPPVRKANVELAQHRRTLPRSKRVDVIRDRDLAQQYDRVKGNHDRQNSRNLNVNLNLSLATQGDLVHAPTYTFAQPVLGGQLSSGVSSWFGIGSPLKCFKNIEAFPEKRRSLNNACPAVH
jgi:hypothetical protein